MSASMDVHLFLNYFPGSELITISGRLFPIQQMFLDDILPLIKYESKSMKDIKWQRELKEEHEKKLQQQRPDVVSVVDDFVMRQMAVAINSCMEFGRENDFLQILQFVSEEDAPINFREETNGYTALMGAVKHGKISYMEHFINLGKLS